jgi:tight adherence protein B
MFQIIVFVCLVVCFASLAGVVALAFRSRQETGQFEDRLANFTSNRGRGAKTKKGSATASILSKPLEEAPGAIEEAIGKYLNVSKLVYQAGVKMTTTQFVALSLGLGVGAGVITFIASPIVALIPVVVLCAAAMPVLWLMMKKKRRMRKFSSQLADSMDVLSRALRSGYSLPAGLQLIGQQVSEPLGPEFMRAFEEQNLGMSVEQSIRTMTERVGNVDLQFFSTAVILQRQTGGDLAEILDKISNLIRERFKIWGQIQALTGEGRLSGIVLLGLPPVLFLVMLRLNYNYVMMLFNEPLGQKMLVFGIIMQILGAIAIKKIITIKV